MTTKQLGFKAPLALAIASGAVTPDPGYVGVTVWSTTTLSLLTWDGNSWEPASASAVSPPTELTLDFGSTPRYSKAFSVAVSGILVGAKVILTPSGNTPAGVAFDEAEFEAITYVGRCDVAGTLKIIGNSHSRVRGQRIVQMSVFTGGNVVTLAAAWLMNALPATNLSYEGIPMVGQNAGVNLAFGEAIYLDAAGLWQLADANGTGTFPARAICAAAVTVGNPVIALDDGMLRNDAWAWTIGQPIYMSAIAGAMLQTATPEITFLTTEKVQVLGYARTADSMRVRVTGEFLTRA